jgi:hypothetical protein
MINHQSQSPKCRTSHDNDEYADEPSSEISTLGNEFHGYEESSWRDVTPDPISMELDESTLMEPTGVVAAQPAIQRTRQVYTVPYPGAGTFLYILSTIVAVRFLFLTPIFDSHF